MKDPNDKVTRELLPVGHIDDIARDVFQWASDVFPNRTDTSLYLKMYEEIGEVIKSGGDRLEVADLFILLLDYAYRKGINLQSAIYDKMVINVERKWIIDVSTGTMHHKD